MMIPVSVGWAHRLVTLIRSNPASMHLTSPRRGPPRQPVLGNAHSLARDKFAFLRACALEYGDVVPLRFLGKRILFVNHPDFVEQIFTTHQRKVVKDFARADYGLIGDGLSLTEGDNWLRMRRLMQPAFHHQRINAYGATMSALAERMVGSWRDGEVRELCAELSALTLAIVAKTLLGVDVHYDAPDLPRALLHVLERRRQRLRSWQVLLPIALPTPTKLRLRKARQQIDRVVYRIIEARRAAGANGDDLLATLLALCDETGQAMSDRQVRDEILTIFVGGNETVVDLLAWTWYLLTQNPSVEAKLLAELDTILTGRPPTAADLPRLPFTGMVLTEALRLYPPAPALGREAITGFELGGYRVTPGTRILVSQWVMHRDPRYFANPESFDPDRWADGLASRLPRFAYFPFGGGPRLCIGKSFALLEATLILASIAQRFRLELLPGQSVVAEAIPTLRPKHGLRVTLRARRPTAPGHQLDVDARQRHSRAAPA
jgi:cytochrome P450